jgi:hypothetical protein
MSSSSKVALVVGAFWLVGCGASPAYYEEGDEPAAGCPMHEEAAHQRRPEGWWTPARDDYATPFALGQTWIGTYHCAQGETNLALHIVDVDGPDLRALFEFDHPPSGAEGLFEMKGRWTVDHNSVELVPTRWIKKPENYVTVGMRGTVSVGGRRFMGLVDGPGCTHFSLRLAR